MYLWYCITLQWDEYTIIYGPDYLRVIFVIKSFLDVALNILAAKKWRVCFYISASFEINRKRTAGNVVSDKEKSANYRNLNFIKRKSNEEEDVIPRPHSLIDRWSAESNKDGDWIRELQRLDWNVFSAYFLPPPPPKGNW